MAKLTRRPISGAAANGTRSQPYGPGWKHQAASPAASTIRPPPLTRRVWPALSNTTPMPPGGSWQPEPMARAMTAVPRPAASKPGARAIRLNSSNIMAQAAR